MKLILFITTFCLFNLAQAACPDFNGRYKWVDKDDDSLFIKIQVTQTGCTNLVEVHDQGWGFKITRKHIIDGVKRLVEDNGNFQAYETVTADANGVYILEERHSEHWETGAPQVSFMRLEFFLSSANELVIRRTLLREDQTPESTDKTTYPRY